MKLWSGLRNPTTPSFSLSTLDFSKAYDRIDWGFLFKAMKALGLPEKFVDMTKILFKGAKARIKVNDSLTEKFEICKG